MSEEPDTGQHHERDWEQSYREGDMPWDSGHPSSRLVEVLETRDIPLGRAIELGCGTGNNAVYLARQGFEVTAVDVSPTAIERAREKAREAGVQVDFRVGDVREAIDLGGPCDFLFDRGCYHCVRKRGAEPYLALVERITRPGGMFLLLTGNADEASDPGPPTVSAEELCRDFEPRFRLLELAAIRVDPTPQVPHRPLGWSCLMRRR